MTDRTNGSRSWSTSRSVRGVRGTTPVCTPPERVDYHERIVRSQEEASSGWVTISARVTLVRRADGARFKEELLRVCGTVVGPAAG